MPTYIAMYKFTPQGIANIKQSPARLTKAKKAVKAAGGKLKAFYLTMGRYDMVTIGEWPDEHSAAKFALALGSQGNIVSETMLAIDETEYRKIVSELP